MPSPLLDENIRAIRAGEKVLPLIVSESDACTIIHSIKETSSVVSLENWEYIPDTFLYTIETDKKEFSIETVLKFIAQMSQKPLYPPALYILKDIDTAGLNAMNALLKILEETPDQSIILLTVSQYETLLPTIQSRTIFISENRHTDREIPREIYDALTLYRTNPIPLLSLLYGAKLSREEATALIHAYIDILRRGNAWSSEEHDRLIDALITLENINVIPRNVLDRVFSLHL